MNPIKKQVLHFLIRIYNGKYRFLKIRKIIKWLMGKERIELKYENVNLLVGTQSAIENSILFDEYNEKVILNLIKYFSNLNYDFVDVGVTLSWHAGLLVVLAQPPARQHLNKIDESNTIAQVTDEVVHDNAAAHKVAERCV